jgi:hypothetical protein
LAEHSRHNTNETTDSGHSVWGPCLIYRLTPLTRTRISETAKKGAPLLSHHQDHHCTKRANPRLHPHGPSTPPCQSRTKRTTTAATHKATPQADHHHCHRSRWASRCDASKKGTTSMTPSSHVHKGLGFHPGIPCCKNMVTPLWCPQQGERRPKGAATIATDSGGLLPDLHHSSRTLST